MIENYIIRNNTIIILLEQNDLETKFKYLSQISNVKYDNDLKSYYVEFVYDDSDLPLLLKIEYLHNDAWMPVDIPDNVVKIYFLNDEEYHQSKYQWGKRHSDPETNAFISNQLIKYSNLSNHIKSSLAVMQAYRSLELDNLKLIKFAKENLEKMISINNLLNYSPSVREDKDHLFLSLLYVMQLINIYEKSSLELFDTWKKILIRTQNMLNRSILRISLINIINPLILMIIYYRNIEKYDISNDICKYSLYLFKLSVVKFEYPFDVVHLKELTIPFRNIYYIELFRKNMKNINFNQSIINHFKVKNMNELSSFLLKSALRTKGKVNERLTGNFLNMLKNDNTFTINPSLLRDSFQIKCIQIKESDHTDADEIIYFRNLNNKIKPDSEAADILRDTAYAFEESGDIITALKLMQKAHILRPSGEVIKGKLNDYKKILRIKTNENT